MKIFVTGHLGQLGSKILARESENVKIYPRNSKELDIRSNDIKNEIEKIAPDAIIHCAAMTDVDRCETDKENADLINHLGTKKIAEIAEKLGARLVYVSTDFVFDGEKGNYGEKDKSTPVSYYGLTKLLGEKEVSTLCRNYCITRTSVIFGWHQKPNFASWIISSLRNQKRIKIITDQFNSPTLSDNLAEMLLEVAQADYTGILHLAGRERISRYQFVMEICDIFDLDKGLVEPVTSKDFFQVAKRPKDSSLNIKKAEKLLKTKIFNCKESFEFMKKIEGDI